MANVRLSWNNRNPNLLLSGKLTENFDKNYDIRIEFISYKEGDSPYGAHDLLELTSGQKVTLREIAMNLRKKTSIAEINVSSTDDVKFLEGVFYQCLS